ncbi:hypothetical protein KTE60_31115 [Burkholderia multivorans]|uniref:hypothetical protein n=1 Tax=Burkholderia multivorans TaxID=87883 RepID=UPI0019CF5E75|nr:hypothetical protein [Burkholderia multivorans]MBN6738896.1 hypothetical protein [Burkholderia multivorans]MBU9575921.1 hypothetical protein [Burkholderia multivorans]MBU9598381.1 hypothetical protein [Burkholderia multivorans]MBU9633741.1 hypothetical protein [Burkholderia multivorans]MBU9680567.1 hypothetical protein [Burkholderia multivorans]
MAQKLDTELDTYRWQIEHLGEGIKYPGHPLVLAAIIMFAFEGFSTASESTEHGWCRALADSKVPGAGDHVGAAMQVLRIGHDGGTVDAMVAEAHRYWDKGRAGGHDKNVDAGRAQAVKIEAVFRSRASDWFQVGPTSG